MVLQDASLPSIASQHIARALQAFTTVLQDALSRSISIATCRLNAATVGVTSASTHLARRPPPIYCVTTCCPSVARRPLSHFCCNMSPECCRPSESVPSPILQDVPPIYCIRVATCRLSIATLHHSLARRPLTHFYCNMSPDLEHCKPLRLSALTSLARCPLPISWVLQHVTQAL